MSPSRKIFVGVVVALALAGGGFQAAAIVLRQDREAQALREQNGHAQAELRQLQQERASTDHQIQSAEQALAPRASESGSAETTSETEMQAWLDRIKQLKRLAAQHPEWRIPEMSLLTAPDWFQAARDAHFATDGESQQSVQSLHDLAARHVKTALRPALERYLSAHDNMLPDNPGELTPFLETPLDPAILARYELRQTGKYLPPSEDMWLLHSSFLIDEKFPANANPEESPTAGAFGSRMTDFNRLGPAVWKNTLQAFTAAHGGQLPTEPTELMPYFPTPANPSALRDFIETAVPTEAFTPERLQRILQSPPPAP